MQRDGGARTLDKETTDGLGTHDEYMAQRCVIRGSSAIDSCHAARPAEVVRPPATSVRPWASKQTGHFREVTASVYSTRACCRSSYNDILTSTSHTRPHAQLFTSERVPSKDPQVRARVYSSVHTHRTVMLLSSLPPHHSTQRITPRSLDKVTPRLALIIHVILRLGISRRLALALFALAAIDKDDF